MTDQILRLVERLEDLHTHIKACGVSASYLATVHEAIIKLASMDARITRLTHRVEQDRHPCDRRRQQDRRQQ